MLGKELNAPVIEMHFPAPQILFREAAIICLAGADFTPLLNGEKISLHQPLAVRAGAVLSFPEKRKGARCYLSVWGQWHLVPWLNSYSTHLKAGAGGLAGKPLGQGDEIHFSATPFLVQKEPMPLPWAYGTAEITTSDVAFLPGPEWDWLGTKSQTLFLNQPFRITPSSDRMGYRLQGVELEPLVTSQLLSSAVSFGTVQLLPNGQLILLMADHQTTGGYPRIAQVISAHLPVLAQSSAGNDVRFVLTNSKAAEEKWIQQQQLLKNLQTACSLKMQNWLQRHG